MNRLREKHKQKRRNKVRERIKRIESRVEVTRIPSLIQGKVHIQCKFDGKTLCVSKPKGIGDKAISYENKWLKQVSKRV